MLAPRNGWTWWSSPSTNSGSMKVRMRNWQYESHCTAAGVHGAPTSASPATTSLPPYTGFIVGAGRVCGGSTVGWVAVLPVPGVEVPVAPEPPPGVVDADAVPGVVVVAAVVGGAGGLALPPPERSSFLL